MPFMRMVHDKDPKEDLHEQLGGIEDIKLFNNQVLIAIYKRPQKTKSGIFLTDSARDEDKFQGKVGLVVKKGSDAFVDDSGKWFSNTEVNVNDWVFFRVTDGWSVNVHGVDCRILEDIDVRGVTEFPDAIW